MSRRRPASLRSEHEAPARLPWPAPAPTGPARALVRAASSDGDVIVTGGGACDGPSSRKPSPPNNVGRRFHSVIPKPPTSATSEVGPTPYRFSPYA